MSGGRERKYKPVEQPSDGPGPWRREVFPADTPARRKEMARIVLRNGRQIGDYRAFRTSLESACANANDSRSLPNTQERGQIRRAIAELRNNLVIAERHMADLGSDARAHLKSSALRRASKRPGRTRQWMGKTVGERVNGYQAVDRAHLALKDLVQWSEDTQKRIAAKGTKRANDAAADLAYSLAHIWLDQTGTFPSSTTGVPSDDDLRSGKGGDFYDLCDSVFKLIWERTAHKTVPKATGYAPAAIRRLKEAAEG